jgi:A118 family predicted phage portal protein
VSTGTNRLTATYVPNMLPNRLDRGSNQGRSDLQGVTPFLDALDEAYSSWWRDIRLAKSRVFLPSQYLESNGPGQGAHVTADRELYVPMNTLARDVTGLGIQVEQFTIRVAEHKDTCEAWTKTIIESAGYSTQSLSSDTGGAVTATEVHSHERRSYTTRGKKVRYWKAAVLDHLQTVVEVANANLGAGITPGVISLEFPEGVQDSVLSVAQTALALRNAEAASTETRVQMVHPDWNQDQVAEEVSRILSENSAGGGILPDPQQLADAGL